MNHNNQALHIVKRLIGDIPVAVTIVERLQEAGLLELGNEANEVDKVLETFVDVFGTTKTTQGDREAADRLVKKHGVQLVTTVITMYGQLRTRKYAPSANNVVQLEEKWVQILTFLHRQKEQGEVIQV